MFTEFLRENLVCLDGGMGTLLQQNGLLAGEQPELWNLSRPDVISSIHRTYFEAGSHVVCTNTFGANLFKFDKDTLKEIVCAAVENARRAQAQANVTHPTFVFLDVGPSGKLLKPLGDLDFEDAVSLFAHTIRLGVACGVDGILIETMNDSYETKAALLAARESTVLPVIVTNAYEADGTLMTGATPEAMVALLEGMGATAIGANCSLGPVQLKEVAERLLQCASVPVVMKPNAGLPKTVDGEMCYDITVERFAQEVAQMAELGVRVVGGCCGTTPEYIRALSSALKQQEPVPIREKSQTVISSYSHAVTFGERPLIIGERINPTGKKRLKEALICEDITYLLSEGIRQQEHGADILDVNVGLPEVDETVLLTRAVCELQAVLDLPLQIDTASSKAMESALRRYNGKALINSVNGKRDSMDAIFPLIQKYGGVAVALTLDENGIPETAEGRVDIAKRILSVAAEYGIDKKNIVFDTLAMTVSADASAAKTTLEALSRIRTELGCHTCLGVSNVSFGLPARDVLNGVFFSMALSAGLSAGIVNPASSEMQKTFHSFLALTGRDANCAGYIAAQKQFTVLGEVPTASLSSADADAADELVDAIAKGLKERASALARKAIETEDALSVINHRIIPALDLVGKGFEEKRIFLPQLLMSAEAAKSAFETIRTCGKEKTQPQKAVFVLATVRGDIHDIGKNIVKLLLENYGYRVIDLGRDVPPEAVISSVLEHRAPFVGLSALMTTTVPAMEETIRLLRKKAPFTKVFVGGAVLTEEYAAAVGADCYCKDAIAAVHEAERAFSAK